MNNFFKIISTILMIVLILILIWVLVRYYNEDPFSSATISEPTIDKSTSRESVSQKEIEIITNNTIEEENPIVEMTDNVEDNGTVDESISSEDESNGEQGLGRQGWIFNSNEPKKEKKKQGYGEQGFKNDILENNVDPVVISSSEKTANQEKQEVLNEIDKALMDLLQVVDKVQTVDESRLGIDESEVHE